MRPRLVREIIKRQTLVQAAPGDTVRQGAALMAEAGCGSVLVCDGERLVGIFTERDLLNRVVVHDLDPRETTLAAVMSADPDTIDIDETAREAVRRMDEFGYRHLPVTDGGRVVGVISLRDLPFETLGRMHPEIEQRHTLAERMW